MILPQAPAQYDASDQNRVRDMIRQEFAKAFMKGQTIEVANGRLVLTDTVTGTRYAVTIVSGTLTLTAVSI